MKKSTELAVVGLGISGFVAAQTAHEQGKSVVVLSKSSGATSLSSGAFDFGRMKQAVGFDGLAKSEWPSVYSKILIEDLLVPNQEECETVFSLMNKWLGNECPLSYKWDKSYLLPTSSGNWKACFACQKICEGADFERLKGKAVKLLGSQSWRFDAESVASALSKHPEVSIQPLLIDEEPPIWDLPAVNLSIRLGQSRENLIGLVEKIKRALGEAPVDFLLLPPMFSHFSHFEQFKELLGIPCGECLSTTEPVAGYRLYQAIQKSLETAKIPIHWVTGLHSIAVAGKIQTLRGVEVHSLKPFELIADDFLLATGKFLGGGVRLFYDSPREKICELPLYVSREGQSVEYRSQLDWNPRGFQDEQDWSCLGVWVDKNFRPIRKSNAPIFENLKAVGSVIGGIDYARAGIGLGFLAISGRRCVLKN